MWHPTIYIVDEAAFLPEAEACLNVAHPVAARIIVRVQAGLACSALDERRPNGRFLGAPNAFHQRPMRSFLGRF